MRPLGGDWKLGRLSPAAPCQSVKSFQIARDESLSLGSRPTLDLRLAAAGWAACETKSVRAHEIERLVVDQIRAIGKDAALRAEVLAVVREQAADVDESDLERALSLFEPVWGALHAKEQRRVLALLIERIDYDGAAGTVGFVFQPSGIQALAGEGQA